MAIIIQFLFQYIQFLHEYIYKLLKFICSIHEFRQWRHEELHSPKYQKFKTDILPKIIPFVKQDYGFLLEYYKLRYKITVKPVKRRNNRFINEETCCPLCGAPHHYLYDNNGGNGQYQCKICGKTFSSGKIVTSPLKLRCPYCDHALEKVKSKKFFHIHKCRNLKCSYYLKNKKKVPSHATHTEKSRFKLHYIYREFSVNFFDVDLLSLPKNASSLKFSKNNAHIMGLCLTYHVNLKLSLRETKQAMKEIHNIDISHTMVANYAKTAAIFIKPFTNSFDFKPSDSLAADETYIKLRGVKAYVWFIMDTVSKSILGYTVSDNRSVGPCIIAMRDAFNKFKSFPKDLDFIADGYSAYPLAAQQFALKDSKQTFGITTVIGLSNVDDVSTKFRPHKQMIERLNRTFKRSYKLTNGFDSLENASYAVDLWVIYYNFLRPFKSKQALNFIPELEHADNMPAKWILLIFYGQKTILELQNSS